MAFDKANLSVESNEWPRALGLHYTCYSDNICVYDIYVLDFYFCEGMIFVLDPETELLLTLDLGFYRLSVATL